MTDEQEALAVLLRLRGRVLFSYAYLLCQSREEAQDLLQEALVKCLASRRSLRDPAKLEAYVRSTMQHACFDNRRRASRFSGISHLLEKNEKFEDISNDVDLKLDIEAALRSLTKTQRLLVIMYYYDDLSIAAIARNLNSSEGNVKRHLSDARHRLENNPFLTSEETVSDAHG